MTTHGLEGLQRILSQGISDVDNLCPVVYKPFPGAVTLDLTVIHGGIRWMSDSPERRAFLG